MYSFNDVWPVLWDGDLPLRGKVWFCETSTTTSKNIFDKDGNALVNPILTNADGRTNVQVILDGDYTAYMYRYIGTDPLMDDADPDNWLLLYDELILENTSISSTASINVETVAALKALNISAEMFSVTLLGYYESGDKPCVTYTWYPASTTAEDGGSVIASDNTVTGRWILTIPQIIDVRDFGVFPDTNTSDLNVYSSQLTACLTYAEKVKRSVKFSSINKTVGYSYYSFEGGSFNTITQKILIDDNVFFLGKDNTTTTLNFKFVEKNSKLLLNTAYTNGTLNLVSDIVKTSWRGANLLTSTISASTYIVDSDAIVAGIEGDLVNILFDGTTGLSLTASYCNFIDSEHSSILDDTDGTISITNCSNFRISYLADRNLSYISTDATTSFILDDVLKSFDTLPASGYAYNFVQRNEGCLVAGYFDRHTTTYKVSDYKTAWDALSNKVPVLDLEGKINTVTETIGVSVDPISSPTIRKIMNGSISGDTFSPEATFEYVLENLSLQSDTLQWSKITASNCRFTGTAQFLYAGTNSSFTNCTFTNSDCTIAGLTDCTFNDCTVNPVVLVNNLHATNTTFNAAVTCGNSYITGGSLLAGLTIDASYCATEVFTYMNIDGVDPAVNIVNKTVHAIKGFVQSAIIDGNVDILPSNASSTDYSSIVRGLDIGYNKITGDFISSLSVGSDASRTHGFIREWVGSAGSLCSLETPNQFSIHDNVKLESVPTNFHTWVDGGSVTRYEPNWPLSTGILHQTNFHIHSAAATWEAMIPVMNKYVFKLCNDYFDPIVTTGTITGQTYGSMTTNIFITISDCKLYSPLRDIPEGGNPGGYQGGMVSQTLQNLVIDAYPVIPAVIIEGA